MMKIYGNKMSNNCLKVGYVAELLGLEYEWKEMDFQKGDMKKPEYLEINPVGKVPAIVEGDLKLWESGAIVQYLCSKNGSDLYPADLIIRATVDQWTQFCQHHVGMALSKVAWNRVFVKMMNMPVDEQSLKDGLNWLDRYLPICDKQLEKNKYLCGEKLSIADITLLSLMEYVEKAEIDISKYPSLVKWRSELQGQDFWKKFH